MNEVSITVIGDGFIASQECDIIYNFVLSNDHIMYINDTECCTLGHGFTDNEVIQHDYYGTESVIKSLQKSSTIC